MASNASFVIRIFCVGQLRASRRACHWAHHQTLPIIFRIGPCIYDEGPTKVAAGSFHHADNARYTAEDFRFTTKGHALYAVGLAWPPNGEAVIRSLARRQVNP